MESPRRKSGIFFARMCAVELHSCSSEFWLALYDTIIHCITPTPNNFSDLTTGGHLFRGSLAK